MMTQLNPSRKLFSLLVTTVLALLGAGALATPAFSATFNVQNYGAVGNGVHDDDPAINNAINAAKSAGVGSVVYFPAGTYFLGSGADAYSHLKVTDTANLTLQGESVTTTLLLSGDATKRFFLVQNASNIVFRNFSMDCRPLGFTQGTIVSRDAAAKTFLVQLDAGYDSLSRSDFATNTIPFRVFTDTNSQSWDQNWIPNLTARQDLGGGQWRLTLDRTPIASCVGKKLLLWPNLGGGWGFDLIYDWDILIEDVSWYGGGWGNAFALNDCRNNITLRRFYAGVPPGSNRLIAGQGCSQGTTRGALIMEDCDVSRVDDDGINQLSPLQHVLEQQSPNILRVGDSSEWAVGDQVSLWDWTYQQQHERDRATIIAAVHNADRTWSVTLDHAVTVLSVGPGPADRAGQEQDGIDRLCDLNKVGTAILRNCRFSDDRARAILIKSQEVLIEGCTIYDSHYGLMAGTETYWSEGPQLRNLTIRSNLFESVDTPALDIGIFYSQASRDCTNILVEENIFRNNGPHQANGPRGTGMRIRNANGAIIRNNIFENNANANLIVQDSINVSVLNNLFRNPQQTNLNLGANYGVDAASVIWVDGCSNVIVSGNLVTNQGALGTTLVSATPAVTNLAGAQNGIFLADQPFTFVNAFSGMALNGAGATGTSATQETRTNLAPQQWKINPQGNGWFTLTCLANGLNLVAGNAVGVSSLILASPSGADEQSWTLIPIGTANVQLVNKSSGLAADVQTATAGEVVAQHPTNSSANQQWILQTAPAGLTAQGGYGRVTLSWKTVSGAISYNLKRATTPGGPYTTIASVNGNTAPDPAVVNGTVYYYVVSAVTALGESADSMAVSAQPSIVATLVAWFKADAITGLANGAAVTTWADASGNGNDASTPGSAPTYVTGAMNGLPVVRFNAAASTYLSFNRPVQDDFTILIMFQSTQNDQGTGTQFYQGAGLVNGEVGGVTDDFGTSLNGNGQVIAGIGQPDVAIHSGNDFNNGQPHVLTFLRKASTGTLTLYVDGALAATGTGGTESLTAPAQLILGAVTTGGGYLSGDLAEVKIFNAALPFGDRTAEEKALKCKYGLSGGGAPGIPTGLASQAGNGEIQVSWTPTAGADSYNLYRSTNGVDFSLLTNTVASSVVDGSAVSGKTNYYAVAAVDDCGASANSPAVVVFLPGANPTLNIAVVGGALTLSWPTWAGDGSLFSATHLNPPAMWSPVTNAVERNGSGFSVTLPIGAAERYFRLNNP